MTDGGTPPTNGDIALACATLLIDELVRGGVRHACLSPGSRSTPLALAASRHAGIQLHVHLDERSAAYVALGIARASGRPAAVICTSGTAVANWLPAVVEASASRVPMVLLSADRPPELRHTGANQTIDQIKIFGDFVRWFVDAAVPEMDPDAARYWRSLGARAVARADGPPAGPVHLNLPFREPLPPSGAEVNLGANAAGQSDRQPWQRVAGSTNQPRDDDVADLASLISATERGVIVAGATRVPLGDSVITLAGAAGWPLLAEPASGLRVPGASLATGTLLCGSEAFRATHVPDVVVQVGAAPTSRATLGLVEAAKRLVIVDPDQTVGDPARRAGWRLTCSAEALSDAVARRLGAVGRQGWRDEWRLADRFVGERVSSLIDGWTEPFEGRIARDLAAALPDGASLVVGSSMPIRDLDAFMMPRTGLRVIANRGASGIDGTISTAMGVATATGAPTWALIGDLTLLHDAGALLWSARHAPALTIVVVNNGGGGIFAALPQSALGDAERELFETPHMVDISALARAAGAEHRLVNRATELADSVRESAATGTRMVEIRGDMRRNTEQHAAVRVAVAGALEALPVAGGNPPVSGW